MLPLKNKLYRFALSYLRDEDEAKDIVQEVMIKLWQNLQANKKINNIEAWSMTCTRNKSLDRMKSKSYANQSLEGQYDLQYNEDDPSQILENKELLSHVGEIVDQLSLKQREVVRLRDFEGMSYKEIEEIMGLDMNQVKVNLFRARKFIKEKMDKVIKYGLS